MSGPDITQPVSRFSHATALNGEALIVVGGQDNSGNSNSLLQKLDCSNLECNWTVMDQELTVQRYGSVALALPESIKILCT